MSGSQNEPPRPNLRSSSRRFLPTYKLDTSLTLVTDDNALPPGGHMSGISPVSGSGHPLHPSPVKSTPYPTPPAPMITSSNADHDGDHDGPGVDVKG